MFQDFTTALVSHLQAVTPTNSVFGKWTAIHPQRHIAMVSNCYTNGAIACNFVVGVDLLAPQRFLVVITKNRNVIANLDFDIEAFLDTFMVHALCTFTEFK